ncbi:amidohydrolase [Tabrizicola sp. J26]|uniref:amidohydrolase n=1 Tax=Alitabrizicola rongguiensis TaxID=2909234 RepID=UPI001F2DF424|nr:amidohydrolase [Tabrizicola rongguiensis]MCF1709284.1 amidohydrolase [Tabrizicola rongguiensis]
MLADILIRNARGLDRSGPVAVGVAGAQIVWVGADEDAATLVGNETRVIDAEGAWVLPGFCDSHIHLFAGGASLAQLNLGAIHSSDALAQALAPHARGEGLLCCYAANYDLLGPGTRPDRAALDQIVPDRPLYIAATDYHCAWANTAALAAAGILHGADAGPGAEVVMGRDGLATGELREFAAMALVKRLSATGGREDLGIAGAEPSVVSVEERTRDKTAIAAALAECARNGITAVANMDGNLYQADLLEEMAEAGELPIRVSLAMTLTAAQSDDERRALMNRAMHPARGHLRFGRVKMFMDGVFDTWTAFRTDDYPGRPGFRGEPLFPPDLFAAICVEADRRGLQIATHAVGDGAVRAVLDGYAAARAANGPRDSRHRIEHIDMLHSDDLPRIAALGVVASMQPVHPPGSSGLPLEPTISIMGPERWRDTFPWRAIADSGATLAFGTDWPVSPLSPVNAINSAMIRRAWAAGVPDQRLTLAEVLTAYAFGGAHAGFEENLRGRLSPGCAADLVLMKGELQTLSGPVPDLTVSLTICDGRVLFDVAVSQT